MKIKTATRHHPLPHAFKNAFTLIELLVVVLIIGILAAVALPQYQKSVEKSKASTYLPLLNAVYTAQKAYFIEHNAYAEKFEELNVSVPGNAGDPFYFTPISTDAIKLDESWTLHLTQFPYAVLWKSTPTREYGWNIFYEPIIGSVTAPEGIPLCLTRSDSVNANDYCRRYFGLKDFFGSGYFSHYYK